LISSYSQREALKPWQVSVACQGFNHTLKVFTNYCFYKGMTMKKSLLFAFTILVYVVLSPPNTALARTILKIGVTDGPQAEILRQVKKSAVGHDLELEIMPFPKGESINRALSDGKLDAVSFQDGVALDAELKSQGYPLVQAAQTVTLPMGLYSRKLRSLNSLEHGAIVAIPRNRLDAARALILLHNYGLIQFRDNLGLKVTVHDLTRNPRTLRFVQLSADQLSQSLGKVSLAAINYHEATKAGLFPARDAIGMEDGRSPYAGVLTIRSADKLQPWVTKLVSAYHGNEIKRFILEHYHDSVRRPW
jgi:YaeC family lipoprotein